MRAGGASRAGGARAPLALALIAAWAIGASAAPGHVRGVRPDLASKYEPGPGGKWSCLDGSRELDFTQVNDDFCHCPDGSDEPGAAGAAEAARAARVAPRRAAWVGRDLLPLFARRPGARQPQRDPVAPALVPGPRPRAGPCAGGRARRRRAAPAAAPAGTSACPNGVFYCRNRGHEPKVMSTAFVDDGVCGAQPALRQRALNVRRPAQTADSAPPGAAGAAPDTARADPLPPPARPPTLRLLRRLRRARGLHQHVHREERRGAGGAEAKG
jgi:hypothetical protein